MSFYQKQLESARKQVLDRGSAYKAPSAEQRVQAAAAGLMRRAEAPVQEEGGVGEGMGMALMQSLRPQTRPRDEVRQPDGSVRPELRYETRFRGVYKPTGDLSKDTSFTSAVEALAEKHGISTSEIYKVIKGESAFNPVAQNKSGAAGLFQFMPDTAKELGTTTDAILRMSPTEQVALYDRYLEKWDYSSSNRLGIMQAAPAFANREPEAVIYGKGTAAWRQNPGWREHGNGPITVRSINSYYAKQG